MKHYSVIRELKDDNTITETAIVLGFDSDSGYNTLKKTEFKIFLKNYEMFLVGNYASHMK